MNNTDELDLKELFRVFWSKIWIIVPVVVLGIVLGFLYSRYFVVPKFSSSTTLILSKPLNITNDGQVIQDSSINQTDISLNQKLISTYGEIIKSRKVVGRVIENLKLDLSVDELKKNISINSVKNTEVMQVTVTTKSAEQSGLIADEIAKVFSEEIVKLYNIQNVSIIDHAEISYVPVNINLIRDVAIFGLIALFLAMAVVFLMYYFDNTVKSSEDVEKYVGLPVLVAIPNLDTFEVGGSKKC